MISISKPKVNRVTPIPQKVIVSPNDKSFKFASRVGDI